MSVKGRFAVDVQFTDSTTSAGVQSLKTVTLQGATEYDFGKIAIVSGTVGTGLVSVSTAPTTYKNAAGDFVSFANVSRIAFVASGTQLVQVTSGDSGDRLAASMSSMPSVSNCSEDSTLQVGFLAATAGTASYTLVLYGS